jgi:hypothetical protein
LGDTFCDAEAAILHQVLSEIGDTQVEVMRKIQQAFGDDAMEGGVTQIKEWFNCFKDDCMSVDSDQGFWRPSMSQNADAIDKVRTSILEDRCLTVQEIC